MADRIRRDGGRERRYDWPHISPNICFINNITCRPDRTNITSQLWSWRGTLTDNCKNGCGRVHIASWFDSVSSWPCLHRAFIQGPVGHGGYGQAEDVDCSEPWGHRALLVSTSTLLDPILLPSHIAKTPAQWTNPAKQANKLVLN